MLSLLAALAKIGSLISNMINRAKLIRIGVDRQRLRELEEERKNDALAHDAVHASDDDYANRLRNKYRRD